jgi:hypothetical protein
VSRAELDALIADIAELAIESVSTTPGYEEPLERAAAWAVSRIERIGGRRPSCGRRASRWSSATCRRRRTPPLFETLAARDIATVSTGFGIHTEANMHAPSECFPLAHLEPGVAAVEDMLVGFAAAGSPSVPPPTLQT